MPQDSSTEPDTRRLLPDGSVSRERPAPPRPTPPAAPGTAEPPVDTGTPVEPAVDAGTPAAVDEPGSGSAPAPPPPGPRDPGDPRGPGAGPTAGRPWWRRRAALVPAAAAVALAAVYGIDLLAAGDDVPRHTVVAGIDIGGLSPAAAADRLTAQLGPRVAADRSLVADGVQGVLHPPAAGISLDAPGTVDVAAGQPLNPWTRLVTVVADRPVDPVLTADRTAMAAQLDEFAGRVDRAPVDATVALDGTTARLVQPVDGRHLDRAGAAAAITGALAAGRDPATPIVLPVVAAPVRVQAREAQRVLDAMVTPALSAPVTVRADGGNSVEVPVSAIAAALTFTPHEDGSLAVALDPAALQTAMGRDFGAFGTPAQDARFEISGGAVRIVPSVDGQGIDPTELAAELMPVLDDPAPRAVTATLGPVPAAFTTEQARALGIKEQIGSFSTNFTNSASGTNIRVVAEKVDGAVVRPGETFSLNGYTGPRGTAQGYVPAAVISGGELSQAVGGGISQFATTMFNAVFFAGLQDVHHKPHSFYISRYPAGREATVYEGLIDLQWRDDTDTGVYVQADWVPGTITVTLWGTKHYDIDSISGERRNIRQPAVQDKVDDGSCTPQSGSRGFDITVTRVFKNPDTGAELRRENFNTHYAAESVIHCVRPPAPEPPAGAPPAAPPTPAG